MEWKSFLYQVFDLFLCLSFLLKLMARSAALVALILLLLFGSCALCQDLSSGEIQACQDLSSGEINTSGRFNHVVSIADVHGDADALMHSLWIARNHIAAQAYGTQLPFQEFKDIVSKEMRHASDDGKHVPFFGQSDVLLVQVHCQAFAPPKRVFQTHHVQDTTLLKQPSQPLIAGWRYCRPRS